MTNRNNFFSSRSQRWLLFVTALLLMVTLFTPTGTIPAQAQTIGTGSCVGTNACTNVSATATIGTNSCIGNSACLNAQGDIGDNSCNGIFTCLNALGDIGDNSCIGDTACTEAEDSIGDNSCIDISACLSVQSSIGDNSCTGDNSCNFAKDSIGNNSCNGDSICELEATAIGDCQRTTITPLACVITTKIEKEDLPAPPPVPLCADISGETDEIVRAVIPPQVQVTIFCRVMAKQTAFIRTSAEVGIQSVLERGVIHAIDVFSTSGTSAIGSRVCLQGSGQMIFIAEEIGIQPESPRDMLTASQDGYTCIIMPANGKVILTQR